MLLFRTQPIKLQLTIKQIATMLPQWKKFIVSIPTQTKLVNISTLAFDRIILSNNQTTKNTIFAKNSLANSKNLTLEVIDIKETPQITELCLVQLAGRTVEMTPTIQMK